MFQSQVMSKVELVIPRQDVVPVTEALANSGVFHFTPTAYTTTTQAPDYITQDWHEQAAAFASLEKRIQVVMEALCVEEGAPPDETPHLIESDVAQMEVIHLEREARGPIQELEAEQKRLNELGRTIKQLEAIEELDVDLETVRNLRYTFAAMGNIPIENMDRLRSSLEYVPSVLVELRREGHLATVVLFGAQHDAEVLNRAARSAYLNPVKLPEMYHGTPAEVIESLKASLKRVTRRIAECRVTIDHLHETRVNRLQHLLWRVRASRTLAETIAQYGQLRFTYLVTGWVPTDKVVMLTHHVDVASAETQLEIATPSRREEAAIPAASNTPPYLAAFHTLVDTYGHPKYGELDPTLIAALTFPLIFGVMFGDVGHGGLLTLTGFLLIARIIPPLRRIARLGSLLIACGISSTAFGFLYGSLFGNEEILPRIWIQPFQDIVEVLIFAVFIGVALLSLGIALNIINDLLAHRWGHMIFGHRGLVGLLFYWSAVGLAVSAFAPTFPIPVTPLAVALTAFGMMVAFGEALGHIVEGRRPLIEEQPFTYLMRAFFELFEVSIGLLSNTLSYVRMGAFAVAHSALSMVVFIIAESVAPPGSIIYLLVAILGNLFVIGFEGMIVGIQSLRLEYYEFFGKFFSGNGVRYHPMRLVSRENS